MASKLQAVKKGSVTISSLSKKEGETEVSIRVRQIKNGYVITKNTEGKDKKGQWKYETEEVFSETNPLEIKTEDKTLAELFN